MNSMNRLQIALACAGLFTLALPQVACAGEIEDLKAMVQQLAAEVKQLKAEKAEAKPASEGVAVKAVAPAGAPAATSATVGSAQGPLSINVAGATVSLYGNLDNYLNYMKSTSGAKMIDLQDGAFLRSRLGFKGDRDVGDGYTVKFQLEQGFNLTNGSAADQPNATSTGLTTSGRVFDRQAWAGLATPYGEFRVGRQNTAIFFRGDYIDFGSRTLGSVVNNFGVPSRYDGDISYISPRLYGLQAELHYATAGANPSAGTATNPSTVAITNMAVYQFALDYLNGPFRVGYAGLEGRPDQNTSGVRYDRNVVYHNFYANYDYGRGKVYLTGIRSNNGGGALSNVGGNLVSNNPSLLTGTNATVNDFYNIYQVSADFKVTPKLRVGGLYGKIQSDSGSEMGASGWALGAYYDVFQNTMVYALVDSFDNQANASFRPSGSAGLTKSFSGADVKGQRIDGAQVGFVFKF